VLRRRSALGSHRESGRTQSGGSAAP
jgi:hypothetical protein